MQVGIPKRECTIDDCTKPSRSRGLCGAHYERWRTGRAIDDKPLRGTQTACSIEECAGKVYGHGLCQKHYSKWRRLGDPAAGRNNGDIETNFWNKVDKSGDCWLWTGSLTGRDRRGHLRVNGKTVLAHRFAYELVVGPIPEGMQIDHMCHVPRCCRPEHLRVVTNAQNQQNHSGPKRNSTSGVRGVWKHRNGRWRARVGRVHVGYFDSAEEANIAVIAKRNELFTHNDLDRQCG